MEARLLLVELDHDDAPQRLVAEAPLTPGKHGVVPLAAEDGVELLLLDRQVRLHVLLGSLVRLALSKRDVMERGDLMLRLYLLKIYSPDPFYVKQLAILCYHTIHVLLRTLARQQLDLI